MKKFVAALIIGAILTTVVYSSNEHNILKQSVVRLHVIANSDTNEDQAIKLKVRDRIIKASAPLLGDCQTAKDSQKVINDNLEFLRVIALDELKKNNSNYDVKVSLSDVNFPTKHYKNVSLPAGNYTALRIIIGEGEGKNWWCVLFPPLCFVDATGGVLPKSSQEKLKAAVGNDEYELLTSQNGKLNVKIKFKILELFK